MTLAISIQETGDKTRPIFTAFFEGGKIGFLECLIAISSMDIVQIDVVETFRRSQVGSSLIRFACVHHPQIREIFIEVAESNKGAIRFYRSLGFTFLGERKNYYRNGENAINMVLKI